MFGILWGVTPKMRIHNLTPHSIKLGNVNIKQSGKPIRVYQETEILYTIHNIPVKLIHNSAPDLSILPPIENDVIYIVSRMVADIYRREDLLYPYDFVKSATGRILGCKALARFE